MTDSEFWQELAEKFRKLDPHVCLYFEWLMETPPTGAFRFKVMEQGSSCQSVRAQFNVLATRAGATLEPATLESGLSVWLRNLKDTGVNDRPLIYSPVNPDGSVTKQIIGGRIRRACEASADLCSLHELFAFEHERLAPTILSAPETPMTPMDAPIAKGHSAKVNAFLATCNKQSTNRVYKRHIWLAVGHSKPRQFEYWQHGDEKATKEDNRNFGRILAMKPEEFIALLKRKNLFPAE